jgi:hypothetical protein
MYRLETKSPESRFYEIHIAQGFADKPRLKPLAFLGNAYLSHVMAVYLNHYDTQIPADFIFALKALFSCQS